MTTGQNAESDFEPGEAARFVLRNWRDELKAFLAEKWPGFARANATLIADIRPDQIAFSARSADAEHLIETFRRDGDSVDPIVTRLAREGLLVRGKADALLRFDPAFVLHPILRLPKASGSATRGALGFELERLSPVPPADLYFDSVIRSHEKATNRVELGARAIRRSDVDEAIHFFHSCGLSVAGIYLGDDPVPANPRYFPLDRGAIARGLWARWGAAALAVLAVLLVVAATTAATGRVGEANDALNTEIADTTARASIVQTIEQKIRAIKYQTAYVTHRRNNPLTIAVLTNLTDALPDGTWVDQVSLNGAKLHIQGYSHAASDLIARLDRSGHFANAQFGAPLVRNTDGTERFDLLADVTGDS